MPLVSFVMPVWQPRADWFLTAVRAVLGQRGVDLELVVVDHGNAEPIESILGEVADARLRVIRIERRGKGPAEAFNAGLHAALGEYLRWVGADDTYELDSTARLLALADGRADIVPYGWTTFCDVELRPIWTMRSRIAGDATRACLFGRFAVRPSAMLFPSAVAAAVGDWDTSLPVSSDWDWVLRATEHATVACDPRSAIFYRKNRQSVTGDLSRGLVGGGLVIDRYFERHPEQRGTAVERRARARLEAMLARASAAKRRRLQAASLAARALQRDPSSLAEEAWRSFPAVVGHTRARVRRRPPIDVSPLAAADGPGLG
jgi:glycosyltransferase involved in cell wall biosynthesis